MVKLKRDSLNIRRSLQLPLSLPPVRDYLRTAAWDRRLTTVEGERDCVFSELEVKLWAEGDGVCFPQKITLIYLLNEPTPKEFVLT